MDIWKEIEAERRAQDQKWGGPAHDDHHHSHDWMAYIVQHLGRATMWPFDIKIFRKQMIRVAALAVAAIEWVNRIEVRSQSGES